VYQEKSGNPEQGTIVNIRDKPFCNIMWAVSVVGPGLGKLKSNALGYTVTSLEAKQEMAFALGLGGEQT
jgi:hypothetical protein